jgi:hypothetical protein
MHSRMNTVVLGLFVLLLLQGSAQVRNANAKRNGTQRHQSRNGTQRHKSQENSYAYWENVPQQQSISWGDLVTYPHQVPRTKNYIRSSVLKELQRYAGGSAPSSTKGCEEVSNGSLIEHIRAYTHT